jgi:hypothetical protein
MEDIYLGKLIQILTISVETETKVSSLSSYGKQTVGRPRLGMNKIL